jgi:hypothetical protein
LLRQGEKEKKGYCPAPGLGKADSLMMACLDGKLESAILWD